MQDVRRVDEPAIFRDDPAQDRVATASAGGAGDLLESSRGILDAQSGGLCTSPSLLDAGSSVRSYISDCSFDEQGLWRTVRRRRKRRGAGPKGVAGGGFQLYSRFALFDWFGRLYFVCSGAPLRQLGPFVRVCLRLWRQR